MVSGLSSLSELFRSDSGAASARQKSLSARVALLASSTLLLSAGSAHALPNPGQYLAQAQGSGYPAPQSISSVRFSCQAVNGNYTVMYTPQSQPGRAYPWANPSALGGGWSPDRRCNEISRRLESYRPDGLLEMKTDVENGYNTICVTTQQVPSCRIVLTVPPGEDPIAIRDRVFNNLTVADSGQQTSAVNAYSGDDQGGLINQLGQAIGVDLSSLGGRGRRPTHSSNINLRPFLDPADGGTGAKLQGGGVPANSNPSLNPDNFR